MEAIKEEIDEKLREFSSSRKQYINTLAIVRLEIMVLVGFSSKSGDMCYEFQNIQGERLLVPENERIIFLINQLVVPSYGALKKDFYRRLKEVF